MAELTMIEAIRTALGRAMEDDPSVIILGEDVGIDGGVFRATDGLVQRLPVQKKKRRSCVAPTIVSPLRSKNAVPPSVDLNGPVASWSAPANSRRLGNWRLQ